MAKSKRKPAKVHWYVRGTGKVGCGESFTRRRWTADADDSAITCKDCLTRVAKIKAMGADGQAELARLAGKGA